MELQLFVLIGLFLLPALLAAFASDLLRAALGLLVCSIGLTVMLFLLGAPMAAVFELSVCAGLITVLFINAISMTKPVPEAERCERRKDHYIRFAGLWVVVILAALGLWLSRGAWLGAMPAIVKATEKATLGEVLWQNRGLDLIGQIAIILVGVFGVTVLFKRGKMNA